MQCCPIALDESSWFGDSTPLNLFICDFLVFKLCFHKWVNFYGRYVEVGLCTLNPVDP
jgi:hypothetical protein